MKITTKLQKQLKISSLAALAYLSIVTSANVMAEQSMMDAPSPHCGHHRGMESEAGIPLQGLPPHLRGLNLSSEQEDKIFALIYAEIPKMREQMKQRRQLMEEMHNLSNTDKLDDNKLKTIAEKLAVLEKDSILNRTKIDRKIFTILTPEQRDQLIQSQQKERNSPEMMPSRLKENKHTRFSAYM